MRAGSQVWQLVTALPGATSNSGGPARVLTVGMARSIIVGHVIFSVAPSTYFRWAAPQVTNRRTSTPIHSKALKPTQHHTYFRYNGQHCSYHRCYPELKRSSFSQQSLSAIIGEFPHNIQLSFLFSKMSSLPLYFFNSQDLCLQHANTAILNPAGRSPSHAKPPIF
ncbi:hypothetical protein AVEN_166641-1 [Araneus ventricosus]|uniref:Uncharacterized protein n=1 Tax=Araneus ventricosus TaxID=182803 RepID=A0A4Y2E2V4_ARAVE|nr:hypothetical protein AVEN_166641-1 [Araneus ventricosus]